MLYYLIYSLFYMIGKPAGGWITLMAIFVVIFDTRNPKTSARDEYMVVGEDSRTYYSTNQRWTLSPVHLLHTQSPGGARS